jgi:hypothetical protein
MSEQHAGTPEPDDADDLDTLDDELELPDDESEADAGDEPDAGEPPAQREPPGEAPPRTLSREQRRVIALRRREREAREEVARLRQQNDQLLGRFAQPQAQPQPDPYRAAEQARQEAERVAMMAPHEVAAHFANQAEQRVQQQLAQQEVRFADMVDKQSFEAVKARYPMAASMEQEVENTLIGLRQRGIGWITREVIFKQLWADRTLPKVAAQVASQRRSGRQRIASQTTAAGSPSSNVPAQRRPGRGEESDAEFDARLKNTTLGDAW